MVVSETFICDYCKQPLFNLLEISYQSHIDCALKSILHEMNIQFSIVMICSSDIFKLFHATHLTSDPGTSLYFNYLYSFNDPQSRYSDLLIMTEDFIPFTSEIFNHFKNPALLIFRNVTVAIPDHECFSTIEKLFIFTRTDQLTNLNLQQFQNLTQLDIYDDFTNQSLITELPVEIFKLSNLKMLTISLKKLVSIPDFFDNLPSLEYLNVYLSSIISLPPSLVEHQNLKFLGINSFEIVHIASLLSLQNLEIFIIRRIIEIFFQDAKIPNCPNHKSYHFTEIQVSDLPEAIAPKLMIYYTDIYSENETYVYTEQKGFPGHTFKKQKLILTNYDQYKLIQLYNRFCQKLIVFSDDYVDKKNKMSEFLNGILANYIVIPFTSRNHPFISKFLSSIISVTSKEVYICRHAHLEEHFMVQNDILSHYSKNLPVNDIPIIKYSTEDLHNGQYDTFSKLRFVIDYRKGKYLDYKRQRYIQRPKSYIEDLLSLNTLEIIYHLPGVEFYYKNDPEFTQLLSQTTKEWSLEPLEADNDLKDLFLVQVVGHQVNFEEYFKEIN